MAKGTYSVANHKSMPDVHGKFGVMAKEACTYFTFLHGRIAVRRASAQVYTNMCM